ncbi:MAG: trypsin-like peptidase domain-containing protein [bacterium]|nr:trypsin-like peptidase domain-containing protein [bacterium]
MFCKYCGKENNDEAKFCKYCGKTIFIDEGKNENKKETEIKCLRCGYIGKAKKGRSVWAIILALLCLPFIPLITVLYFAFSHKWACPKCDSKSIGEIDQQGNVVIKKGNLFLIIFLILISIAIIGILASIVLVSLNSARQKATELNNTNYSTGPTYSNSEIAASVVNIYCENLNNPDEGSGGSGTIITTDGIILTNSHIIPQDKSYLKTPKEGCLVVLPDPITGSPKEWYWGNPIVIPGISDTYDIAYIQIYDAYYDSEEGAYWGTYPKTFPALDNSRCIEENVKLGEPIRVFGYPEISGGYSLTVTDGIVSSFSDGLIYTSAKISSGNSGGLAVDNNGCFIGIPAMVSNDKYESLGVIISNDLISQFVDELNIYLKENNF